jgi:hypothetical protein
MKNRLYFYMLYILEVLLLGFLIAYFNDDKLNLIVIVCITFIPHYLSALFLLNGQQNQLVRTIIIWAISFLAGIAVFSFYGLNKNQGSVEVYMVTTFFIVTILCYEISTALKKEQHD